MPKFSGGRGGKAKPPKQRKPTMPKGDVFDPDDEPLYTADVRKAKATAPEETPAFEPFSDGVVSVKLRELNVIHRIGGEEVQTSQMFLTLFAKTETYIGSIASKASFMKKMGGRLM